MSSKYCLLLLGLLVSTAFAIVVAVPEPPEMIKKADTIAVGCLAERDGKVYFRAKEVLKGTITVSTDYELRTPNIGEKLPEGYFVKITKGNEFLLVASLLKTGPVIEPIFGLCSIWPQGTTPELLPYRTVPECVAFARQQLQGTK